jgi:3-deoxy-D-manno-octulosonic-acid transferase
LVAFAAKSVSGCGVMGWQWQLYRAASNLLPAVAPTLLKRRLARGKEHPARWREKMGVPSLPRPKGRLIWINAVGLGEVLALRGLISAISAQDPNLKFLITTTARSAIQVIEGNMPKHCLHQFLPLDAPQYVHAFLQHWKPDLSVWAEQDIWPNAVMQTARDGVPLAMVNARINDASYSRRARLRGLYKDVFKKFDLVLAQDTGSAQNLLGLGARHAATMPLLKPASPPLSVDSAALAHMQSQTAGRRVWFLASSWSPDEDVALFAHQQILANDKNALLIIAPRDITRAQEISQKAQEMGLSTALRTSSAEIGADVQVYIANTFGEMGLWYRLCRTALIGGSFGATEGHNPWEAAILDCAILHGPRTGNFRADYEQLSNHNAALLVDAASLPSAILADHSAMTARAKDLVARAQDSLAPLAKQLLALMK